MTFIEVSSFAWIFHYPEVIRIFMIRGLSMPFAGVFRGGGEAADNMIRW
jgi:hypothetical protein